MKEYKAFTLHGSGRLNQLQTNALIISKVRDASLPIEPRMWNAIWDTGACKSCISKRVVDNLHLIPIGKQSISTANGVSVVNTYFIDVGLPNGVMIPNVLVSCADIGDKIDMLIGMDIITLGDFSITNFNGLTTFSFRIPSIENTDFVDAYYKAKQNNS